jgi:tyrosyl-tRNA synthetase
MEFNHLTEELQWRGLLHDSMPGVEDLLKKEHVKGYVGFDPTADSLHIGNLVPVMMLVHLQRYGHTPIALVGGATGMVGDPSGKTAERQLLGIEQIQHNLNCQSEQLQKFLDFESITNAAQIVNNYDWFKDWGFLDFIRQVGKHLTVNYMLAKDSVRNRLEQGMSFTEFSYQLIQGYDFLHLYKSFGVKLQMGGSDQWGNITTGTELIRRMEGGEAYAITAPLVKKADGTKFGKSEGGNIWLDRKKTSPYKFYQYWLNTADEDAVNFIKTFSLKPKSEIEALIESHVPEPHLRKLQNALADELTERIHSADDLEKVKEASAVLFGNNTEERLKQLDEETLLSLFEGVPQSTVVKNDLENGINLFEFLADKTQIFPSRGEARKMFAGGGLAINKTKVTDENLLVNAALLLQHKYILVQKGKKNYFLVTVVS